MQWIIFRIGENIPKQLCYNGYQKDKDIDGYTPLMLWIKERRFEPIPEELYYDSY